VYLYTERLDLAVELFYAVLSIGLLLGAILSLYFVENALWRIGIIVLFTLLFAACAVFLADGRRLAVFGACAAYAAVLVVFVSSSSIPGTGGPMQSPLAPV
jgi:dipeptide/tripeptide permease